MTNHIETIMQEFEKIFGTLESNYHLGTPEKIRSALRQICEKMMSETKTKRIFDTRTGGQHSIHRTEGYNQALADIKAKQQEFINTNFK